jgi:hypothetical protein
MWKKPGARATVFQATEDFAVERVAFSWRARFPIVGPLAMTVVDGFADGAGELRVSLLGIALQTQTGPETNVGEAMRYLAELAWAPHAIAANRELKWRDVDARTVEVECDVAAGTAGVRWEFNDAGDLVRATGVRPFPVGELRSQALGRRLRRLPGVRGHSRAFVRRGVVELPDGRFVYWRGRVTALELVAV